MLKVGDLISLNLKDFFFQGFKGHISRQDHSLLHFNQMHPALNILLFNNLNYLQFKGDLLEQRKHSVGFTIRSISA